MSHNALPQPSPVVPFSSSWPLPTLFGAGCTDTLGASLAQAGARHVLLMTDAGLVACGIAARLAEGLASAGVHCTVFDRVRPNPLLADVADAVAQWHAAGADTIVALGGGSVMDSSKVLAAAVSSDKNLDTVVSQADDVIVRRIPSFIAIPTTAGTGSESTTAALIKDPAGRKRLMRSNLARPTRILLDPSLTVSVPAGMTAATGFDVIMHALGALGTTLANPIGELLAHDALSRATRHLPGVVRDGSDLQGRSEMLYASYLAGLAISMNGVDAIHGLCTPLESVVDRPHGHVLSVTFAPVMRANLQAMQAPYAHAARLCGYADAATPDAQAAQALYEGLDSLRRDLGLPLRLADIGVHADRLAALPELALASRATQINRQPLGHDEIAALYAAMA